MNRPVPEQCPSTIIASGSRSCNANAVGASAITPSAAPATRCAHMPRESCVGAFRRVRSAPAAAVASLRLSAILPAGPGPTAPEIGQRNPWRASCRGRALQRTAQRGREGVAARQNTRGCVRGGAAEARDEASMRLAVGLFR